MRQRNQGFSFPKVKHQNITIRSLLQIKIMWSSTTAPKPNKLWTPNHFVPVVPASATLSANTTDTNFSFNFQSKSTPKPGIHTATKPTSPSSFPHQSKSTPKPRKCTTFVIRPLSPHRPTTQVSASPPPSSPYSPPSRHRHHPLIPPPSRHRHHPLIPHLHDKIQCHRHHRRLYHCHRQPNTISFARIFIIRP